MPRNIELKARLDSLDSARAAAQQIATACLGTEYQRDTYFVCPHGRLKLRQRGGRPAQLIWYLRPDALQAGPSDYQLLEVSEPDALKQALSAALGVRVAVEKQREIFLFQNVRIHLDQVVGLGDFLEFEAVLDAAHDEAQGHVLVAELSALFAVDPSKLVDCSYSELLIVERPAAS